MNDRYTQLDMTCVEPPLDPFIAEILRSDPPWLTFGVLDPTKLVLLLPGFDADDVGSTAHWEIPFAMLIDSALEDGDPPYEGESREYMVVLRDMLRTQADRIDEVLK